MKKVGGFLPSTHWTDIQRMNAGDQAAADAVFGRYRDPIFRLFRLRGHPGPDADDLTQETIHALIRNDKFRRADRALGRFRGVISSVMFDQEKVYKQRKLIGREVMGKRVESVHALMSDDADFADFIADPDPPDFGGDHDRRRYAMATSTALLRLEARRDGSFAIVAALRGGTRETDLAREAGITVRAMQVRIRNARRTFAAVLRDTYREMRLIEPTGDLPEPLRVAARFLP